MNARPTLTSKEAASVLGVSLATISRLVRQGHLRGYQLTPAKNSPLRIYQASIEELLRKRERGIQPIN